MSFYIGTKQQTEEYDDQVSASEGYEPPTQRWFEPIALPNGNYAVRKKDGFLSQMDEVETITEFF